MLWFKLEGWHGFLVLNVLIFSMHGLINGVNGGLVGMYY
jgi:hypothetical protein